MPCLTWRKRSTQGICSVTISVVIRRMAVSKTDGCRLGRGEDQQTFIAALSRATLKSP